MDCCFCKNGRAFYDWLDESSNGPQYLRVCALCYTKLAHWKFAAKENALDSKKTQGPELTNKQNPHQGVLF